MSTGSSDTRPFGQWFQIRWAERLGDPDRPYLIRWTFILFGRSIRIHHWLRSDDRRYFHDHSADMLSIVLRGRYCNVVPRDERYPPSESNSIRIPVEGMFNSWRSMVHCAGRSMWLSTATGRHFLDIPKEGAWTILFEGRKYHKWGFYVPRKGKREVRRVRPLEYFHRYGIAQADPAYQ